MKTMLRLFVAVAAAALILFARRFNFSLEEWSNIAEITSAVFAILLGIPAILSFLRSNREREEAFRRERVLATLPSLEASIREADEYKKKIDAVFAPGEMIDPDDSRYTPEVNILCRDFLNRMERIGLVMNIRPEVYDLETFALRMGGATIDRWERSRKDIERRRGNNSSYGKAGSRLFSEFEKLKDSLYEYYMAKGEPFKSKFAE